MKRLLGIVVVVGSVAAGCSGTVSPAPTATVAATTSAATAVPSAAVTASPTAVATPSSRPAPSVTQPDPTATGAPPPKAEIIGAATVIPGELGSYVIDGHGSDGPWLPFDVLPGVHVAASEALTARFADGVPIGDFVAVIATAADTSGSSPQGVPARAAGSDNTSLIVGPLPAGKWVLSVRLFRADGRGDGTTYWAVTAG